MRKRLIALTLTLALLISVSPTVFADDTSARPTVEEILSDYHQAAFEAETSGEASASTYSRSGSAEQTLEQQTVNTLNEAGYEAYNITADNYDTLEEQLQSDFSEMGFNRDGSYIVVIHGEEENSTNGNARLGDITLPPHLRDDGSDSNAFSYYYDGTTYTMRYVTVTAATNTSLGCSSRPIDLLAEYGLVDVWEDLELPIEILTSFGLFEYTGTIYSLFTPVILNTSPRQTSTLTLTAGTNWTVTYTQVQNTQTQQWVMSGSIEYVNMSYVINHYHYSSSANAYVQDTINGTYGTVYSELYNDKETMKQLAALAFDRCGYYHDTVDYVTYSIDSRTSISHYRWDEPMGYEPA